MDIADRIVPWNATTSLVQVERWLRKALTQVENMPPQEADAALSRLLDIQSLLHQLTDKVDARRPTGPMEDLT